MIFAIFAFATCGGFQGETVLLVSCQGMVNKTVTAASLILSGWIPLYLVHQTQISAAVLGLTFILKATSPLLHSSSLRLQCWYSSTYIAAVVVHIGYKHVYNQNRRFPLTDLVITVITAFLWLVSTSAWAKVLADIKMFTGASIILGTESCKAPGTACRFAAVTSMGALNMPVVFGLINMILWGGNIWFLYKDTNLRNQPNRISQSPAIYQIQRGE